MRETCDRLVKIPMGGLVESLNVFGGRRGSPFWGGKAAPDPPIGGCRLGTERANIGVSSGWRGWSGRAADL